jgi:Ca2+:H+ antiporter
MGKPSDAVDHTADHSRSWSRHLNWNPFATRKQQETDPEKNTLPTTERTRRDGGSATTTKKFAEHTTNSNKTEHEPSTLASRHHVPIDQPYFAPNLVNTEAKGEKPPAIDGHVDEKKHEPKPPYSQRAKAGSKRFIRHTKNAICHSWINLLLVFVPIGIAAEAAHLSPAIVFAMNAVAVIPLAGLLAHATETVASRLGDTLGALLNVSFGNAVELIIL